MSFESKSGIANVTAIKCLGSVTLINCSLIMNFKVFLKNSFGVAGVRAEQYQSKGLYDK